MLYKLTESHKDAASLVPRLSSKTGRRKESGNEARMLQSTLIQYTACVSDEDIENDYKMYMCSIINSQARCQIQPVDWTTSYKRQSLWYSPQEDGLFQ